MLQSNSTDGNVAQLKKTTKNFNEDIMNKEQIKNIETMGKQQLDNLKEEYEEKGYFKIQNFFSNSEIETIKETLERAKNQSQASQEKVTLKLAKHDHIDTKDHAYDLVKYDFVSSLIQKKLPFLNYVTGKKIMIMHNALFSVEPNQTGLPWHVGVGSFSFTKTEDFGASIWIPLDEITKDYRGGMQYVSTKYFPGQFYYTIHDLHFKNNIQWDESKGDLNEYVANANTILNSISEDVIDYTIQNKYEEDEYKVGDVLFFNKYVLHRSVPLKPGLHKLRRAFVIRLVDYDTRVDEERLGLFSQYSQLHSRYYKTLPRYNKDSVLVMVSRSIKQGLKSPYLRDIPYIQKTLSERVAIESENIYQNLSNQDNNIPDEQEISDQPEVNISHQNQQPLETLQTSTNFQLKVEEVKEVLKQ
ncbi:MAG: phytanoyl-CoA dioxygenase family protein, partial [Calothrix sp. MO_192.B10]|nr:phytanoyl-CoA dioxygenase family protein [Calothrix sp. MO_192.B10]